MTEWLLAVGIGVVLGLAFGVKIALDSHHREPVRGGPPAQALHYLACAGLAGVFPFVLAGIIIGLRFLVLFGTAAGLLALAFVLLLGWAVVERRAAPVHENYVAQISVND